MKKFVILVLLCAFGCLCKAEDKKPIVEVDGYFYECNDTVLDSVGATLVGPQDENHPYPEEVVIPASITVDGVEYPVIQLSSTAFLHNTTTKRVTLGPNVLIIDNGAFYESDIEEIIFNDKLWMIGRFAFYNCPKLREVEFPKHPLRIDLAAFSKSGIKKLHFKASIGNYYTVFYCPDLETIIFDEGVGSFDREAFNTKKVTSLEIPGSMNLNSDVFAGIYNLKKVTLLPVTGDRTRQKAQKSAFSKLQLEEIISLDPEAPNIDEDMMTAEQYATCILKVPEGCADAYRAAPGWCKFANIMEIAGVDDVTANSPEVVETQYFDALGRRVSGAVEGRLTIVREKMTDGSVRVRKTAGAVRHWGDVR